MEDQLNQPTNTPSFLDVYTGEKLAQAAKTAGIAAFISLASAVIGLIAFFKNPAPMAAPAKEGFDDQAVQLSNASSAFSIGFSLVINLLLFFLLYRFSSLSISALKYNNRDQLQKGLYSLSAYFKTCAIIIILAIGFVVVASFAAGIGAALK